jgi:hypothetical protein
VLIPEQTKYTGNVWPGFTPSAVNVIQPSPEPIANLILTDPATGATFARPTGSAGGPDTDTSATAAEPTTVAATTTVATTSTEVVTTTVAPTTTAASTTTEATTTTPAPTTTGTPVITDITRSGTVEASTVFGSNEFPSDLATDGKRETSWFSAGDGDRNCVAVANPGLSCSAFGWQNSGPSDVLITEIRILNNSRHARPEFQHGFGFGSVTVIIRNLGGSVVFQENFPLNGKGDDPDFAVQPNVVGHGVELVFEGHDNAACGGFSELQILAAG